MNIEEAFFVLREKIESFGDGSPEMEAIKVVSDAIEFLAYRHARIQLEQFLHKKKGLLTGFELLQIKSLGASIPESLKTADAMILSSEIDKVLQKLMNTESFVQMKGSKQFP